ncbi:hypothetical protein AS026_38320 [Rhizobium altiplani]|uniref:Resolvase/invertase-type recombinase catalytic domain-containing protein n=1 Tax=Rhizobium altiplani TaxID=1864509 RepID=A0A125Q8P0_9HYPH|nr:hypothetical protein AS026_38320 [Rhizobium altiplani]
MSTDNAMKIRANHLQRDAFLYVRQSSLRQVFENTESTKRQYALRDRALELAAEIKRNKCVEGNVDRICPSRQDSATVTSKNSIPWILLAVSTSFPPTRINKRRTPAIPIARPSAPPVIPLIDSCTR